MAPDGQKLSKRLKNYPPIEDVFNNEGADTLRYYLLSSTPAVTADYMNFDRDAMKDIGRNLFMTLYNSASFLSMYTEIDNWSPSDLEQPKNLTNPLDKWLIARVNQTIDECTKGAESYELSKASWPIYKLVDDMSNWYVRRSRRRFWKSEDDTDKLEAYQTLYWALVTICQLLAPWSPFMSDWLYRHLTSELTKAPASVHLTDWPKSGAYEEGIVESMQTVRSIVNDGLAARAEAGIKVRQPLAGALITSSQILAKELVEIVSEELNVKKVEFKKGSTSKVELDTKITQTLQNEGIARDIIRNIQSARKDAGLQVENRIKLVLLSDSEQLMSAIEEFQNTICKETLTSDFSVVQKDYSFTKTVDVEKQNLTIQIKKA